MYVGENSKESIFAFDYKLTIRTNAAPQNNQARNSSGYSGLIPTRALADSYECTDGLTIDKSTFKYKSTWFAIISIIIYNFLLFVYFFPISLRFRKSSRFWNRRTMVWTWSWSCCIISFVC